MLALSEPPSFTATLKPQPCSLAGDTLRAHRRVGRIDEQGWRLSKVYEGRW